MSKNIQIRYGAARILDLEAGSESLIAVGGVPCGEPLSDVPAATAAALTDPIDYPPLGDATLPSDSVCLAIDRGVPQVPEIVAGVVQSLVEAGVSPTQIRVVLDDGFPRDQSVSARLTEDVARQIQIRFHDPNDGNGLAYLATSSDGDPIQINREFCDADVVIPISCIRAVGPEGDWGQPGSVFPTFADSATRERYAAPWESLSTEEQAKRKRGRDEAAWLLGARLTLQVISGGGDRVLHIVAGDVDSVGLRSRDLATTAWGLAVPRRSQLVIAAIEGDQQQTWENVTRAIVSAQRVATEEGAAIVICSDVKEMPNPAMIRALISDDEAAIWGFDDQEGCEPSRDTFAGGLIRETLQRCSVFLLSQLPEEVVLDLGLAFVSQPSEVKNLLLRYLSCTVLSNAQHVLPTIASETANH